MIEHGIIDDVRSCLKDRLEEFEGRSVYGCDLGYELFDDDNRTGAIYIGRDKCFDILRGAPGFVSFIDEELEELDMSYDMYRDSEAYLLVGYMELGRRMLEECKTVSDSWNDELRLDSQTIADISDELDYADPNGAF